MKTLQQLRTQIDNINEELLRLLNERAQISLKIGQEKAKLGQPINDPIREQKILETILKQNNGPYPDEMIIELFQQIFEHSKQMQSQKPNRLLIEKISPDHRTVITINGQSIGGQDPIFIFGPCSIESEEQLNAVANTLRQNNLRFIRGGAFKPRSSPYAFQGLGKKGLDIMHRIAHQHDLISVVEVIDEQSLLDAMDKVDIIQIGARNMQNFSLLKAVGKTNKPVLLKRGFQATIEEFKWAAEYILAEGNSQVILCERGIRTYERATRNTLDISAIPILKQETHLPVIVDVSHAAGRKDILLPLMKAALAAGCDGIMAEVHPNPQLALSDAEQQLNLDELKVILKELPLQR